MAAYYVFRGRVSRRWSLVALVVGVPLAVAFALVVGARVLFVQAISG